MEDIKINHCLHIHWSDEDYDDVDSCTFVKCLDCGEEFKAWDSKKDCDESENYLDLEYYISDDFKTIFKI